MIISRTPVRISFLGGGTDYPDWYLEHGGAVISSSIDKYVWVMFNDGKVIASYDVPIKSGLATSSAHTVALLKILAELKTKDSNPAVVAQFATLVEQDKLDNKIGSQDQHICSVGGFRLLRFSVMGIKDYEFQNIDWLAKYLLLFHTQQHRLRAGDIVEAQLNEMRDHIDSYYRLMDLVEAGRSVLEEKDWQGFGNLLDESWQIKRQLSSLITTDAIDNIYSRGLKAGAVGGKILGSGGGGCILFLADPSKHEQIKGVLTECWHIPFQFEKEGSKIIHKDDKISNSG